MSTTTTGPSQAWQEAMAQWEDALNKAAATGEIVSLTEGLMLAEQEVIRAHEAATMPIINEYAETVTAEEDES